MKFYKNIATGEETSKWSEAQMWHRAGFPVQVWKDGRNILTFNM